MTRRPKPTLGQLAALFDSVICAEGKPEGIGPYLYLCTIDEDAKTRYDALHQRVDDGPTLWEVAEILSCLRSEQTLEGGRHTLLWFIQRVPEYCEVWDELAKLAQDAGYDPLSERGFFEEVIGMHRDVDRLLAVPEWKNSWEVLDPDQTTGASHDGWLSIIDARLARREGDQEQLLEIRRRIVEEMKEAEELVTPPVFDVRFQKVPLDELLRLQGLETIFRNRRLLIDTLERLLEILKKLDEAEEPAESAEREVN